LVRMVFAAVGSGVRGASAEAELVLMLVAVIELGRVALAVIVAVGVWGVGTPAGGPCSGIS